MADACITEIERFSIHDGPGIRTAVFLKGCPLHCAWCHNPECISFEPEPLFYPERCIGCGRCADGCYSGARVMCGRRITADALLTEVLRDRAYYGRDGGVTFTGGEPMAHAAFVKEAALFCRRAGVGCAIETSLFHFDEDIFRQMDVVMADLKIWDDATHRTLTGASVEPIKENFKRLNALGIPIYARTPVIPGIAQEIDKISAFLFSLENVKRYELLPYHPLGNAKRAAMGLPPDGFSPPTEQNMEEMNRYAFLR